jgi:hypothetical protein
MLRILIIICLVFTTACTGKDGTLDLRKPYSLDLTPPPGPREYEQGWSDGCESGSSAYANNFYKLLKAFDLKYDPAYRTNKMYQQVWKDAFLYCAVYWATVNGSTL